MTTCASDGFGKLIIVGLHHVAAKLAHSGFPPFPHLKVGRYFCLSVFWAMRPSLRWITIKESWKFEPAAASVSQGVLEMSSTNNDEDVSKVHASGKII